MTGKTLTTYIQEKRIHEAACLLRSYDSINQAAERVGFTITVIFIKHSKNSWDVVLLNIRLNTELKRNKKRAFTSDFLEINVLLFLSLF